MIFFIVYKMIGWIYTIKISKEAVDLLAFCSGTELFIELFCIVGAFIISIAERRAK